MSDMALRVRPGQLWRYSDCDSSSDYVVLVIKKVREHGRGRRECVFRTQVIQNKTHDPDSYLIGEYRNNYWPDDGWELVSDV